MRDDFHTECPFCEEEISVNRTSSNEPIPRYDDEPKSFYVSCSKCYGIFQVEILVVKTMMMGTPLHNDMQPKFKET
jgi:transcription elongation factor Elf1